MASKTTAKEAAHLTHHGRQFLRVVLGVPNFIRQAADVDGDAHVDRGGHVLEHHSHLRLAGQIGGTGGEEGGWVWEPVAGEER